MWLNLHKPWCICHKTLYKAIEAFKRFLIFTNNYQIICLLYARGTYVMNDVRVFINKLPICCQNYRIAFWRQFLELKKYGAWSLHHDSRMMSAFRVNDGYIVGLILCSNLLKLIASIYVMHFVSWFVCVLCYPHNWFLSPL